MSENKSTNIGDDGKIAITDKPIATVVYPITSDIKYRIDQIEKFLLETDGRFVGYLPDATDEQRKAALKQTPYAVFHARYNCKEVTEALHKDFSIFDHYMNGNITHIVERDGQIDSPDNQPAIWKFILNLYVSDVVHNKDVQEAINFVTNESVPKLCSITEYARLLEYLLNLQDTDPLVKVMIENLKDYYPEEYDDGKNNTLQTFWKSAIYKNQYVIRYCPFNILDKISKTLATRNIDVIGECSYLQSHFPNESIKQYVLKHPDKYNMILSRINTCDLDLPNYYLPDDFVMETMCELYKANPTIARLQDAYPEHPLTEYSELNYILKCVHNIGLPFISNSPMIHKYIEVEKYIQYSFDHTALKLSNYKPKHFKTKLSWLFKTDRNRIPYLGTDTQTYLIVKFKDPTLPTTEPVSHDEEE